MVLNRKPAESTKLEPLNAACIELLCTPYISIYNGTFRGRQGIRMLRDCGLRLSFNRKTGQPAEWAKDGRKPLKFRGLWRQIAGIPEKKK